MLCLKKHWTNPIIVSEWALLSAALRTSAARLTLAIEQPHGCVTLENLEATKTSSEEAVKKMAPATGNIAVSIPLLGKCFSAQYRET